MQKDSSEGKTNCTDLLKTIEQKTHPHGGKQKVNVPASLQGAGELSQLLQLHYACFR